MTSFLIIAFVTVVTVKTDGSTLVPSDKLYWVALTISIVGFFLSYGFSMTNFLNARMIYEMGLFLRRVNESKEQNSLPHFVDYVSKCLVRKYKFGIRYVCDVPYQTIVFLVALLPYVKTKGVDYKDQAPHTWLIPMVFAFVWIVIFSVTFIEPPWLLPLVFSYIPFYIAIAYAD